jgi:DNA-binding SARP family transcriptional activator
VSDCADAPLAIRLFGPFEVHLHGAPLRRLRTRKGQWLLALLTLRSGYEVERAWLAWTLWPDSDEPKALTSLRKSLTDLRQALNREAVRLRSPTSRSLCLELAGAEADVVAFDAAIARGDPASLEIAVSLYRGSLLEECAEEWVFQERQAREQAYLAALETLAARALAAGDPGTAERHLRRAVVVDPLRESAHRALMQALAADGKYAAAMQVYRELRLLLHRELSAEPDPETTALFHQLRAEARHRAASTLPAGTQPAPVLSPHGRADREGCPELTLLPERPITQGTITFLLTDIEGSTKLWLQHPEAMRLALARHDALLSAAIEHHGGTVLKQHGEGDSCFAVFPRATDAVAAALALQRALALEPWPLDPYFAVRV